MTKARPKEALERKIQAEVKKYQNNISGGVSGMSANAKDSLGSDFLNNLKLPDVNSSPGKKRDTGVISLRGSLAQNNPLE